MPSLLLLLLLLFLFLNTPHSILYPCQCQHPSSASTNGPATSSLHSTKNADPIRMQQNRELGSSSALKITDRKRSSEKEMMASGAVASSFSGALPPVRRIKRSGRSRNPGFNVDYVEPKTHPPSHN